MRNTAILIAAIITMGALIAATAGQPVLPTIASHFIASSEQVIPAEGASIITFAAFDGPNGRFSLNSSSAQGWSLTLQVANAANISDGTILYYYLIDGEPVCYRFVAPVPLPLPAQNLPAGLTYERQVSRFGQAMSAYQATLGRYRFSAWVANGLAADGTFRITNFDKWGMGCVEDVAMQNGTVPPPSLFVIPSVCTATEPRTIAATPEELVDPRFGKRAHRSLYEFKTRDDVLRHEKTILRGNARVDLFTATPAQLRAIPDTIDNTPFASPVRCQSMCGACWAFSSVAAAEIAYNFANNRTTSASQKNLGQWGSVQQIIDCAHGNLNGTALIDAKGCNGGWPLVALDYIVNNGIMRDDEYTFDAATGTHCRADLNKVVYPLVGAKYIPLGNGPALNNLLIAAALAQYGAVVAIINVPGDLEFFGGGIYTNTACKPSLAHAVTIVGTGIDPETKTQYWTVKNSFGAAWASGGYFKITRGQNICGIEDMGFVPLGRAMH